MAYDMQMHHSFAVDRLRHQSQEALLPVIKVAYCHSSQSVIWASLGVHLLRPPHKRTLGRGCQAHILCGTLTVEFLDASGFWTPAITGNSLEILLSLCN